MTGEEADFALWLAEFEESRPPGTATDEEALNTMARVLFTNGWTLAEIAPCEICGLLCCWRNRDGVIAHPICPDAPPNLTWDDLAGGTARLRELMDALRYGFRLTSHAACVACERPTRYRDAAGDPWHPSCAAAQWATIEKGERQ